MTMSIMDLERDGALHLPLWIGVVSDSFTQTAQPGGDGPMMQRCLALIYILK